MTKAVLVHARNPLVPTDMRHARTVDLPVKLSALVEQCYEASGPGRRVVSVNGEYVLPVHGDREICARDIVVVEDVFEGGAGGKGSLRLVLMMAAVYFLGPGGALGFSPIQGLIAVTVANMLIMSLIPPPKPQKNGPQEQPTATYSTSLSGNQARLDGVIPVGYGYMRSFPDFAAQPYTQYENNEQDYFALLCVGKGKYTIEHIEIDDTEIDHFIGVQKNVVEPGQPLTLVLGNVATALEVSGQELIAGKWVGPITACKANNTVSSIGVDIVLNGLGKQNGTSMANASVRVRFDIREIDHNGVPVDGALWETAIDQTINGASASQVRHSFYYYLPSPKRIQVRGGRVDAKIDTIETANTPTWGALRAYLAEPATLDPASTYIEIKMRATDQLNGLSQRRIAVKWQRLLKQWTPELGWAAEEVPTRSIAWALADIASSNNPSYAGNMGDNRLDLQTLYELDQIWSVRQDRFDYIFDQPITLDQALRVAAKAGRAVPIQRSGVYTFMRDQEQTLPVAMYTPRNMKRGSFKIPYILPTSETPDAVDARYFSNVTWKWEKVRCNAPGITNAARPQEVTLEGVCGAKQAEREGLYMAADHFYRRRYPQWTSQLDGLLPAYGSLVLVAHDVADWGQVGDIVDYDAGTQTLKLSEPPEWGAGTYYIRLHRANGVPTDPLPVVPGLELDEVILLDGPLDFTPVTHAPGQDRTRFVFGTAAEESMPCRVKSLVPRGLKEVDVVTVAEDVRVHRVDQHLLPSPGEIQDPIFYLSSGGDEGGGGSFTSLFLTDHAFGGTASEGFIPASAVIFRNNGQLQLSGRSYLGAVLSTQNTYTVTGEYVVNAPVTPAQLLIYELRFTLLTQSFGTFSGTPFNTWLVCNEDRSIEFKSDGIATVKAELRLISTGVVQEEAIFTMVNQTSGSGGGGA
jgi:hypothetical protein